ncbi:MAG: hypothetical protein V4447_10610 [Pseudomonadota bacterium]
MLTQTIPSYAYVQYNDDADIVGFVNAFNVMAQEYVDFFNQIGLPIYTGPMIAGALLDWVAAGLYGFQRPALSGGVLVSDDVFKRIITWHFYKGDGKVFDIRWLKRRIMRFLAGADGTDPGISQTYQISVTFGPPNIVYINILSGIGNIQDGFFFNQQQFNASEFEYLKVIGTTYVDTTMAATLKQAIDAGVCELPFQYTYVVGIST